MYRSFVLNLAIISDHSFADCGLTCGVSAGGKRAGC